MGKYEFSGETKQVAHTTFHRIVAVKDFGNVKTGDIGGWLEKEENLSQSDNAWVWGNAKVWDDARVWGNAKVWGDAWVYDNAEVYGNAKVSGNAQVFGNAEVCGNAKVYGNARVYGNTWVGDNGHIFNDKQILVVGPIGSRADFTTFYRDGDGEITVKCGCFCGKIKDFLTKVLETHGDNHHAKTYRAAAELAKVSIDLESKNERR